MPEATAGKVIVAVGGLPHIALRSTTHKRVVHRRSSPAARHPVGRLAAAGAIDSGAAPSFAAFAADHPHLSFQRVLKSPMLPLRHRVPWQSV